MKTPSIVISLMLVCAAMQSAYYYPKLPDTLASHFNGSGGANGFSSKPGFFLFYWAMIGFSLLVSLGIGRLIAAKPDKINVPNKDYWLSEERFDRTLSFVDNQFKWLGAGLVAFSVVIIQLVIQANLSADGLLPANKLWLVMGIFMALMLFWVVRFTVRFLVKS